MENERPRLCVVCNYPVSGNRLTCSDRCHTELKSRQRAARSRQKTDRETKMKTMSETINIVVGTAARILLDWDIPTYPSNVDIDAEICKRDPWWNALDPAYRRGCITKNIDTLGYAVHATGNRGKKTYRRIEPHEVARERLVMILLNGV